jgi:hypothetical protein
MKQFFLLFSFCFLLFSCSKNTEHSNVEADTEFASQATVSQISINATAKDGVLHFPNIEAYNDALKNLNEANLPSIKNWEKQIGFLSVGSIFESLQLLTNQDQPAESQEIAQLLEGVSAIRVNDLGEYALLTPHALSFVLNEEGLVYIGNELLKFTEKGQYLIPNGSLSLLREVELSGVTKDGESYFVKNTSDSVVSRACGYSIPIVVLNNATSDRRSNLIQDRGFTTTTIGALPGTVRRDYWVDITGVSQKKNIFGNWVNYNGQSHILEYNFSMGIFNESALFNAGVNLSTFNKAHAGTRTRSGADYVSYFTGIGFLNNIPLLQQPNADMFWDEITLNRHTHQGMTGFWNFYTCQ